MGPFEQWSKPFRTLVAFQYFLVHRDPYNGLLPNNQGELITAHLSHPSRILRLPGHLHADNALVPWLQCKKQRHTTTYPPLKDVDDLSAQNGHAVFKLKEQGCGVILWIQKDQKGYLSREKFHWNGENQPLSWATQISSIRGEEEKKTCLFQPLHDFFNKAKIVVPKKWSNIPNPSGILLVLVVLLVSLCVAIEVSMESVARLWCGGNGTPTTLQWYIRMWYNSYIVISYHIMWYHIISYHIIVIRSCHIT